MESLAIAPSHRQCAVGFRDGLVTVSDLQTREVLRSMCGEGPIRCVAFSPDGEILASGEDRFDRESVRLWRVADGAALHSFHSRGSAAGLAFTPDGRSLVWSEAIGGLKFVDLDTGAEWSLRGSDPQAGPIVFVGTDRLVCAQGEVSKQIPIVLWNIRTKQIERVFIGHEFAVRDLAVLPLENELVSAGDATIRIWKIDHEAAYSMQDLEPTIDRCLFLESQRRVITSSEKSSISGSVTGKTARCLRGSTVTAAEFSPSMSHQTKHCWLAAAGMERCASGDWRRASCHRSSSAMKQRSESLLSTGILCER